MGGGGGEGSWAQLKLTNTLQGWPIIFFRGEGLGNYQKKFLHSKTRGNNRPKLADGKKTVQAPLNL